MSVRDVKANMAVVRSEVEQLVDKSFPKKGRNNLKAHVLAECGVTLLECFLTDHARIADALETIATQGVKHR